MVKMRYVRAYQSARLSAFIHPEGNDAGSLWDTIRNMISGAHFTGRGDCEKIGFFNSDYMLTFVIHYYGILAAVLAIAVIGAVLIWFLQKTGHQKNQLGMIMGTGCVVILFTQFIGYVVENLGCFPLSNNYCPFLTAGGSGIMISYIMFGILLSIYRYQNVLVETEVKKKIGI